jgi:sugar phosphate isomerase/epimerase
MKQTVGCTTRPYEGISFREACGRIAGAGYAEVAVFGHFKKLPISAKSAPKEVDDVIDATKRAGLIPSTVFGKHDLRDLDLAESIANYKNLIDNTARVGAKWLLDIGIADEAKYDAYYEMISEAAPYAQEKGVVIVLKPHGGIALTARDTIAVCERIGHPAFRICYDPGNLIFYNKGKEDLFKDLEEIAALSEVVIIKDCVVEDGVPDVKITPGEGLVDFDRILECFAKSGFDGSLYVECVGGSDLDTIDQNLRRTRVFIEDILAKHC